VPDIGSSALTMNALLNGRTLAVGRRAVLANELRTMRAGNMMIVYVDDCLDKCVVRCYQCEQASNYAVSQTSGSNITSQVRAASASW